MSAKTATCHLIFNPSSDRGRNAARLASLHDEASAFPALRWHPTHGPAHATALTIAAGRTGADRVIAIGGDGTVHEVVNGLMALPAASRPALGVVPCGSGNDFAWCAGLPAQPSVALHRALTGRAHRVDVGRISNATHGTRYFANSAGLFIVAAISIRAREITRFRGLAMYLLATVRSILADYAPVTIKLRADERTHHGAAIMLSVGNGPREGGGFLTNPDARHDDGLLDYMLSTHIPRTRMLRLLPDLMRGRQARHDCVTSGRCAVLALQADGPIPVHLDGEIWATTSANLRELEFAIEPGAITLVK